jgi:hypothetical protein
VVDVDSPFLETCEFGDWPFRSMYQDGWYDETLVTVAETTIDNYDYDPYTNSNLIVGCNRDCKHVGSAESGDTLHVFKCPLVWEIWDEYGTTEAAMPYLCTDRCGDGIMDGPITDGVTTLRGGDMPTGISQIFDINKITPYYKGEGIIDKGDANYHVNEQGENYSSRLFREQCDNGGIVDTDGRTHGCDEWCQIESGWTCTHYYHHLIDTEYPVFTSYCELSTDPCVGSSCGTGRRLSPESFDSKGRLLHHLALDAYFYTLPENTHQMRDDRLRMHFSANYGSNGQLRLFESPGANEAVFGFTYVQQYPLKGYNDKFHLNYYNIASGVVSAIQQFVSTMADDTLEGKQRGSFGQFQINNANFYEFNINGYVFTDEDNISFQN